VCGGVCVWGGGDVPHANEPRRRGKADPECGLHSLGLSVVLVADAVGQREAVRAHDARRVGRHATIGVADGC
jgi:hypothetical protein